MPQAESRSTRLVHHSWRKGNGKQSHVTVDSLEAQVLQAQANCRDLSLGEEQSFSVPESVLDFQKGLIPVYDAKSLFRTDIDSTVVDRDMHFLYEHFFHGAGCFILRGVYTSETMDRFNVWCEKGWENAKKRDANIRHPKQAGKLLLNDVINRMGAGWEETTSNTTSASTSAAGSDDETTSYTDVSANCNTSAFAESANTNAAPDAELLLDLLADDTLGQVADVLLGFAKFGACTAHWIEGGGDRQLSHVDYPMHVGSGPFWQHSYERMQEFTTRNQVNNILKYFSVQILIASDAMDAANGSTEVIPASQSIEDLDVILHSHPQVCYEVLEPKFVNVELHQGDVLMFCRGLCHRGGKNESSRRRNALIIQAVYLWGVGQEIINSSRLFSCEAFQNAMNNKFGSSSASGTEDSTEQKGLSPTKNNVKARERFLLRLCPPYPKNVTHST